MTVIQFTPSDEEPFQFQPTLGNAIYTVLIPWNIYAQRYYIAIYTLQRQIVYYMPLIGSPAGYDISLLPALDQTTGKPWASTLVFRESSQAFEILP